jgi:hypothetical protein
MAAKAAFAGEGLPLDGRVGTVEDGEDFVFLFYDALESCRGEDEEGLKLAEMEEAHHGVDVGGLEEDACDWGVGGFLAIWG